MVQIEPFPTRVASCRAAPHPPTFPGGHARFWTLFSSHTLALYFAAQSQFFLVWWIYASTACAYHVAIGLLISLLALVLSCPLWDTLARRFTPRLMMSLADSVSALCTLGLIARLDGEPGGLELTYPIMVIRSAMVALQVMIVETGLTARVAACRRARVASLSQTLQGGILLCAAPMGILVFNLLPIRHALAMDLAATLLALLLLLGWKPAAPAA